MMRLVEEMVSTVANEVLDTTKVQYGDATIDFAPPYARIPIRTAILERSGVDFEALPDTDALRTAAAESGVKVAPLWGRGKIIDELMTLHVEPHW
jgi:lysyl-tRNA synthetase class 2